MPNIIKQIKKRKEKQLRQTDRRSLFLYGAGISLVVFVLLYEFFGKFPLISFGIPFNFFHIIFVLGIFLIILAIIKDQR